MENYKHASEAGQDLILAYFKKRMKELKISQKELALILEVNVTTLWRIFRKDTAMTLDLYLQMCGALKVRPYLIPAESDNTEMIRLFFN